MTSFNAPQPFKKGDAADLSKALQRLRRFADRVRYGDEPFQGKDDPYIVTAAARYVRSELPAIGRYAESRMKAFYQSGPPDHRKSAK